jgi:hypothetical protein
MKRHKGTFGFFLGNIDQHLGKRCRPDKSPRSRRNDPRHSGVPNAGSPPLPIRRHWDHHGMCPIKYAHKPARVLPSRRIATFLLLPPDHGWSEQSRAGAPRSGGEVLPARGRQAIKSASRVRTDRERFAQRATRPRQRVAVHSTDGQLSRRGIPWMRPRVLSRGRRPLSQAPACAISAGAFAFVRRHSRRRLRGFARYGVRGPPSPRERGASPRWWLRPSLLRKDPPRVPRRRGEGGSTRSKQPAPAHSLGYASPLRADARRACRGRIARVLRVALRRRRGR